ncbi:MAG: hypothetical protein AB7F91_14860 [Parvularculaceae bacterium]|nr:hypothetical protein [Parvularculaceae bacterium]
MKSLLEIKRHVDGHGFGSAIVDDHVAIGVVWTTNTLGGEVRKREIIERVHSFEEACTVMGCRCGASPADASYNQR